MMLLHSLENIDVVMVVVSLVAFGISAELNFLACRLPWSCWVMKEGTYTCWGWLIWCLNMSVCNVVLLFNQFTQS